MTSVSTDRRFGVNGSLSSKAPCKAAATTNIVLSGEQTIDSQACVTGDRILLTGQTDGIENGVWIVDTSTWQRSPDWDGARDVVEGTFIYVNSGANAGHWSVTTNDPITPGTTSVAFAFNPQLSPSSEIDTVGTLAALRATTPVSAAITYVKSHTTLGDDGGGNFRAVTGAAAATYTDDNGLTILPTGGDGSAAWLRDHNGSIYPEWFGAVGDNSNDDATALNACTDASLATGFTTVLDGSKTYKILSAWTFFKILVQGNLAVINKAFDGEGIQILEGGSSFTDVRDLTCNASGTQSAGSHNFKVRDSRVRIKNCRTTLAGGDGLNFENDDGNCNHSEIEMNADACAGHGFHFNGAGVDAQNFKLNLRAFNCAGDGILIDLDGKYWIGKIISEDCTGTNLNIDQGSNMDLEVYLEGGGTSDYDLNAAVSLVTLEGRLGSGTDNTTTCRLTLGGNNEYPKGTASVARAVTGTNVSTSSSAYIEDKIVGSSDRLLVQIHYRGDGVYDVGAYDTDGVTVGAKMTLFGDDKRVSFYTDGVTLKQSYVTAMPASGSYDANEIAWNVGASFDGNNMHILGWRRLTTGSGHVLNTDWKAMYVSSVSPAT